METYDLPNSNLHKILIGRQSESELLRKAKKSKSKNFWTQEEFDLVDRRAHEMHALLVSLMEDPNAT